MGCSCSNKTKKAASIVQPKRNIFKPVNRVIHKSSNGSKTLRRIFDRY